MDHKQSNISPIEDALLELDAADKARLFRRTSVDADALLCGSVVRSPWRFALRALSTAAAVLLVVGVWSLTSQPGAVRHLGDAGSGIMVAQSPVAHGGAFHECFGGPTGALPSSCLDHDYDTDGDVDLADFGAYQLTFSGKSY